MSIALIAHYIGPRLGIGQYLERLLPPLAKELQQREIDFTILASPNAYEKTPSLQKLGDVVRVLPPLDYSPYKRYGWVATGFANYCRQEKFELVAWLSNPTILPWHPPSVAVLHDVNEWKASNQGKLRTILRGFIYLDASIKFSQKIIVISKATQDDLFHFRSSEKLKQKVRLITNGVDSGLINQPPIAIDAPKAPFLLYVGRIDPASKRLPEAVELVKEMREVSNQEWELHLVGGMNASTQAAGEEFIASIENLPWVTYHGYVDDPELAQWYRQATGVVFLSDFEGFGLPIAEAASFGRWAIVSQVNQAGMEAGGKAVIAVDTKNPRTSAQQVLERIQAEEAPNDISNLPQWSTAAQSYGEELSALL